MSWMEALSKPVRPVITYALTAVICYLTVKGKVSEQFLLGAYGTMLGFYFGERSALKRPGQDGG